MNLSRAARRLGPWYWGGLLALFLLAGRWGLARLSDGEGEPPFYLEVRFWTVLLLAPALLPRRRPEAAPGPQAGGAPARGAAAFWLDRLLGAELLPDPAQAPHRRAQAALLALLALLAYLMLAALWAPRADLALLKAYDLFLTLVVALALWRKVREPGGKEVLEAMWASMILLTLVIALTGLISFAQGQVEDRLAVLGGGPNVFGRLMALLGIAAFRRWRLRGGGWILLPLVSLAVLLVLLSGSRGSLIGLAAAMALYLYLEGGLSARTWGGLALAGALLLLVMSTTELGKSGGEAYEVRVQTLLVQERYSSGRDEIYAAALKLGLSLPVLGAGLSGYAGLELGDYPHNLFLEIFAETGGVGLLLLLANLALVARALRGRWREADTASLAAAGMLFVSAQFSGDLYDSRGIFLLLLAACARLAASPPSSASPAPAGPPPT